jgi:4-hydroxy-2-oxoheptanedioate aldolase
MRGAIKTRWAIAAVLALCVALWIDAQPARSNPIVELLKQGKAVFGSMVAAADRTEAGGTRMGADPNLDFVFYDLERNFDIAALKTFLKGVRSASTGSGKAVLVRIPPIGTEPDKAAERVAQALEAGADGIVFPHVENKQQAEMAVRWLGRSSRGLWPQSPDGQLVGYFMIEDRQAVEHAKEIISTKGATMFAPGQGSLSQAYNGDAKAVESAVQSILSACKEAKVTCAKLASDADIERRIAEGFRLLMASGDALVKGRKAAGR